MSGNLPHLIVTDGVYSVCRLDREEAVPAWATRSGFFSVTRTEDELSVVCPEDLVPEGVRAEGGWRAIRVAGVVDFAVVGLLAGLAASLAGAGVSLFALSTFDTDYLLVKESQLGRAVEALRAGGYPVTGEAL